MYEETAITASTRDRIEKQRNKLSKIMNLSTEIRVCKECEIEIEAPKKMCEPCRLIKLKERQESDKVKNRKIRYCKNETCGIELINTTAGSQRYCSDACRPQKLVDDKYRKRGKAKKVTKLDPKWTMPRGSKKRKLLGLKDTEYGNHSTGGYSEV